MHTVYTEEVRWCAYHTCYRLGRAKGVESDVSSGSKSKKIEKPREHKTHTPLSSRNVDPSGGGFLRTNWQIQGYLSQQAAAIEGLGTSFPLNAFEPILRQLQKLAPELHRVHFLRYLNSLHHYDYLVALDNLHRYFDYSKENVPTFIEYLLYLSKAFKLDFYLWSNMGFMEQIPDD
ncbi:hypothetical protein M9H77_34207 [Catharanthus roseus]|uniref:Uncharacterized protein n=1 Tax=Catharanthus roseus TaxID=4058 RepID=A0ACB9ZKJ7_CATRO|nr:hypothetical protein M9H77_34207 [Catharanthus roseus]